MIKRMLFSYCVIKLKCFHECIGANNAGGLEELSLILEFPDASEYHYGYNFVKFYLCFLKSF